MSEIIQGTDAWKQLRLGKVTASRVADVVAKTKSGYSTSRANYAAQLIADNACAHDFVLGAACPPHWRTIDLATHQVWGFIGNGPPCRGIGCNALGDPRVALTWLEAPLVPAELDASTT